MRTRPSPVAVVVLAELFGTSLWFAGAVAAPDLAVVWGLSPAEAGRLLMATQLGFVVGTLAVSLSGLADRLPASRLFAASAAAGAGLNAALLLCESLPQAVAVRFGVGVCLAGVYPLGMKLVVSWAPDRAGVALGWLVGALTVGTATPHLIRGLGDAVRWETAVVAASVLSVVGGLMVFVLGDGPALRPGGRLGWGKVRAAFAVPRFRANAIAYYGHAWELYAFWAAVPALIGPGSPHTSRLAFAVIAVGGVGCVLGGRLSRRVGSARVAAYSLAVSAACCLLSPLLPGLPAWAALGVLFVWGFAVVADSPQYSALAAATAPADAVGSGLAVQNAIGFAVTLVSLELLARLGPGHTILLAVGPLVGLVALRPLLKETP